VYLEVLIFRTYFTGESIPQFDFMGAYNEEAFEWWRSGSFFAPAQWIQTMYGGYPAVSNLQNSSFYLPVGIASAFGPFTYHASAILSALHVAFGSAGVYIFCRRWGASGGASLAGLSAWFFANGFYASSTTLDIMRAYAWLPWLMLVFSVKWPWRRWWAPFVALLIVWQTILAIYPGMIVAIAYVAPVWVVANQWAFRLPVRRYLLPAVVVTGAAIAMSLLRFLPALMERGHYPATLADTSVFSIAAIGTFLFPYNNSLLPGIEQFRSLFVPGAGIALLVFVPFRDHLVRCLIAVVATATLLGFPFWPWHDLVTTHFPGMQLSRFRLSDFKFLLLFGICILGVRAIDALAGERPERLPRTVWIRIGALVIALVGFALVGMRYQYEGTPTLVQWSLFAVSAVLASIVMLRGPFPSRAISGAAIALTIASGTLAVYAVPGDWQSDRVSSEQSYLGASVDSLIAASVSSTASQMPARIPTPLDPTGIESINSKYGRAFFTGQASVFGYVNLRGTETFELVKQQLYAPGEAGLDTRAFWNSSGVVVQGAPSTTPPRALTTACASTGACGADLQVTPISYDSAGRIVYRVTAATDTPVMVNVAGYKGWAADVCSVSEPATCQSVTTARGSMGELTLVVPRGSWTLNMVYRLPGLSVAWVFFWFGIGATIVLTGALWLSRRRTEKSLAMPETRVSLASPETSNPTSH
jgi:hypothetical protein